MKTKYVIYISNPEAFLKGDIEALSLMTAELWDRIGDLGGRVYVEEVSIDLDSIDRNLSTEKAITALDERETLIKANTQAEITNLKRRKSELLAIPFMSGESK